MERDPRPRWWFSFLGLLALGWTFGCGPRGPIDKPSPTLTAACSKDSLGACETALSAALDRGDDIKQPFSNYARARKEKDPQDEIERVVDDLKRAAQKSVLIRIGDARAGNDGPPHVDLITRPKLEKISLGTLFLLIGTVTDADLLIVSDPEAVTRVYPRDPLGPMMAGLQPITVSHGPFDLQAEGALEHDLRSAVSSASEFEYVAAADSTDRIDAYVDAAAPFTPSILRASILSSALSFSKPVTFSGDETKKPAAVGPPALPDETPYYDLLRIRSDGKEKEWGPRGPRLLAALPADFRDSISALFDPHPSCGYAVPPPMTREKDLVFVGLLPHLLLPAHARSQRGRLHVEDWYPLYAQAVATTQRTKSAWFAADWLIFERGQGSGILPSGQEAHRIVTSLGVRHARALKKLATERPGRVGLTRASFLASGSNAQDPELRKEVMDLAAVEASASLGATKTAGDTLFGTFISVLIATELPSDVRDAHLDALQGAFTAKLHGDYAKETGWEVALMFTLDAAYRELRGQGPNLARSSEEIVRALGDKSIPQPALAELASAMVRYLALATQNELGPELPRGQDLRPERARALASLTHALSQIGAGKEDALAKDVAELADGTIATVALAVAPAASSARTATSGKDGCTVSKTDPPLGPSAKNALARLRDIRRRVFSNASFKDPKSELAKRLKLVTVVLSDAIDLAEARGKEKTSFELDPSEVEKVMGSVLGEWIHEPGVADTLAGTYVLIRGFSARGAEFFKSKDATRNIQVVLSGLGAFFRDDDNSFQGAELLTKLLPAASDKDLAVTMISLAKVLYAEKKGEEADMLLLGSMVITALHDEPPREEALATARAEKSDVSWVLSYATAIGRGLKGEKIEASSFVPEVEAAMTAHCGSTDVRGVGDVVTSIADFRDGKRKEARDRLRGFVDRSLSGGFAMPRFSFAFQQETRSKVFSLTLDFGLGRALLGTNNSLMVSAGAKSPGEPVLRLTQTAGSPEAKPSVDDGARYVVHAAVLLAVWDFLENDPEQGDSDAARAMGLISQRTSLVVPGVTSSPGEWAKDARGSLAVLAVLAAEAGRPLLAGDLLSLLKGTFDPAVTDAAAITAILDPIPDQFNGVKDVVPQVEKARKMLKRLLHGLPCLGGKPDAPGADKVTCDAYPEALGLRIADSYPTLPTLGTNGKGSGGTCPDFAAMDGFFQGQQQKVYDPDKFLLAVDALIAAHKYYDASVLLVRQRRPDHCSASVTDKMRSLVDRTRSGIVVRADLLAALANCQSGVASAEMAKSLSILDDELVTIGDPQRDLSLLLAAADFSLAKNSWEPLQAVAMKPGFLERWEANSPELAAPTLLFDHVAFTMAGKPVRLAETQKEFDLICGGSPAPDRLSMCRILESLRKPNLPDEVRIKAAKEAIKTLTAH